MCRLEGKTKSSYFWAIGHLKSGGTLHYVSHSKTAEEIVKEYKDITGVDICATKMKDSNSFDLTLK